MDNFFTDTWVAAATGMHRTTVSRWRRRRSFPPIVRRLARLELDGELGAIHAAWTGWRLDRKAGELVTPDGWTFTPGEIRAYPLRLQEARALRRELDTMRSARRRGILARLPHAFAQVLASRKQRRADTRRDPMRAARPGRVDRRRARKTL